MQKIERDFTRHPYGVLPVGDGFYLAYLPGMHWVYPEFLPRAVIELAALRLNRHYHQMREKASDNRILVALMNSNTEAYAAERITQQQYIDTAKLLVS